MRDVPNLGAIDQVGATLLEVAGRDNALRTSLAGYSLEVRREWEQ